MSQIFSRLSHGGRKSIKKTEILMKPLEEASQKIKEFSSKYRNFSSLTSKAINVAKIQSRGWINGFIINNLSMADFTNIPPALPIEKAYSSDKVPISNKKIADLKKSKNMLLGTKTFMVIFLSGQLPKQMTALRMLKSRICIFCILFNFLLLSCYHLHTFFFQ